MMKLFCDLKTDEEKSAFFLSGRGYETGVIAHAIQNDVAMAYHRCSEYRNELEALQAECEKLRSKTRVSLGVGDGGGNLFVHGDYDSIKRAQALIFEREELRNLLRRAQPIIKAHAEASRMLDGFRPKRNQWDELMEGIDAAMETPK